jgi:hypothetical protein
MQPDTKQVAVLPPTCKNRQNRTSDNKQKAFGKGKTKVEEKQILI